MKYLKRIAVVLILCLAAVGTYALLKKPPQLHVPEEDRAYLEEVFGGSEFTHSGEAEVGGLSGLMNHGVEGVPSIGSGLSSASNAPPAALTAAPAAPPYGFQASTVSEAPTFATASNQNPANGTALVADEAPAFQTSRTTLPPLANQSPFGATPAPQYGSAFPSQAPPQSAPPQSFQPQQVPQQYTPEYTPQPAIPTAAPDAAPAWPSPQHSTPQPSPPISAAPPPWDGPATPVAVMPSSISLESRGASAVLEQADISGAQRHTQQHSPQYAQTRDSVLPNDFSSLNFSVIGDSRPAPIEATNVQPDPPRKETDGKTVFVRPSLKRLPIVPGQDTVPSKQYAPTAALAVDESKHLLANDFQQTSARNTMVLTPMRRRSPDEVPKVSFAQQSPKTDEPIDLDGSSKTLVVAPIVPLETQTLPFVASQAVSNESASESVFSPPTESFAEPRDKISETESSATGLIQPELKQHVPQIVSRPTNTFPATDYSQAPTVSPGMRDTVGRFIEAQCRAANSGDPERLRSAFVQLSRLYDHKELNETERAHLIPILDRMGVDIIFSCKQHVLEPAYTVKADDTIDSIAASYRISPALLMKINGLTGARPLKPGMPLKIVHGQFDAKISTANGELILILGGLYAGRFPVTVGEGIRHLRGDFVVASKSDSHDGRSLTLNNGVTLCIGEPDANSLGFSLRNANELFDILTESSVITME